MSYTRFVEIMQQIADINYASAVLMWDQETYMPKNGDSFRSRQIATLSGLSHNLFTNNELSDCIDAALADHSLDQEQHINVLETKKILDKKKKMDADFVMHMSRTISNTFIAWQKAKTENDLSLYVPQLTKIVELKKQEAQIIGYSGHIYNALLDEYEPEMTTAELDTLFSDVKIRLKPLLDSIQNSQQIDDSCLKQFYPKDIQWQFGLDVLKSMGYDFDSGRQDISSHPFTTSFNVHDVRVTTRIDEHDIANMLWSCIHEGGHALYEQGLPSASYGLPTGEAVSLGIHESQSRLWENNVGRSMAFWKYQYPKLQNAFPTQLANISLQQFYAAMNKVEPSFIRTESDELTYHFHIMIRYELEKALISNDLSCKDLPAAWNEMYKKYLGLDVTDHRKGLLQDVHWSHGSFGYFPTYSLGSFFAAQFYVAAQKEIPDLIQQIEQGNTSNLLAWLRKSIHAHGRKYKANDLCKNCTGSTLMLDYFMDYAKAKYSKIYNF